MGENLASSGQAARCEDCSVAVAEFFDAQGRNVCRRCFYAGETRTLEQRAKEATIEELPEALREAVRLEDKPKKAAPNPPGTLLRQGILLMVAGAVLLPVAIFLETGILFALGVMGFAFVIIVRGYKLRHYM